MQVMIYAKFGRISHTIDIEILQASLIFVIEVNAFGKVKEFINFSQHICQFNEHCILFGGGYQILHRVELSIYLFDQLIMFRVVL